MAAKYRYYFGSLRTPGVIAEISLYGVNIDMELNVGGQFNGSFQLDQTGKRNSDLLDATIPGFSFIYVERNDVVIWGGYVWSRTYQSQAKVVQLYCSSFEKYPDTQLLLTEFLDGPTDIRNIFCALWNHMQLVDGRNLGVTIPPTTFPDSFVTAWDTKATDYAMYGEIMSRQANSDFGFDWYIACSRVGSDYIKQLLIGDPLLGQDLTSQSIVFEYPGVITNYYMTESMSNAGTHITVTGAGDGSSMIVGRASDDNLLAQGWPRWDQVISHKDVQSQILADSLATQELTVHRAPKLNLKVSVVGGGTPDFGAWSLGDNVKVVIKDARNPNSFTADRRIIKWVLTPSSADSVEEYQIIFAGEDNV